MPRKVVHPIGIIQRTAGEHATIALTPSPTPDWQADYAPAVTFALHR